MQATQTLARGVLEQQSLRQALGGVKQLTTVRTGLAGADSVLRLGIEVLDLAIASVRPTPEMARALEPVRTMDWRTLMAISARGNDPKVLFAPNCLAHC